jgi:hypothetical protein
MVLALDPFHDLQRTVAGYPDADGSGTVVSCYQYSYDVSAPAGAPGTWDAHVFSLPVSRTETYDTLKMSGPMGELDGAPSIIAAMPLSLLNIITCDAGCATLPAVLPFQPTHFSAVAYPTDDTLVSGTARVVGYGIEVVNTTPQMYVSGAVTAYRMGQPVGDQTQTVYVDNPVTVSYPQMVRRYRMPPSTVADAVMLLGSKTWEAKDGVYLHGVMSGVENPLLDQHYQSTIFYQNSAHAIAHQPAQQSRIAVGIGGNPGVATAPHQRHIPYCTSGAFFTGLSAQTTLKVRMKVYVERAPTPAEVDLVPLASPSAGYDVSALMLYAKAVSMLPVGVPVTENAAGDWFRRVLQAITSVAPALGLSLTPVLPGAGKIGSMVADVATSLSKAMGPIEKDKQQRPKMKRTAGK